MDTKCNNDDQITISRAIMTFVFRNTLLRVNFFPVVVFVSKVSNTNKYTILPIVSILLLFCLAHTMCLRTTPLSKQNLCSACNYVWIECVLRHTWPKNMLLRALLPPTIIHNFRIRFRPVQFHTARQRKRKISCDFFSGERKKSAPFSTNKTNRNEQNCPSQIHGSPRKTPVAAKQAPLA